MRSSFESQGLVQALREAHALRVDAGLLAWSPPEGDEAFYREAVALRLPLAGTSEEAAERGALVSYTPHDPTPIAERMAEVAEQVLRGAAPATVPFRYPQTFRLVVNKRTARSLGFALPSELEIRADRIID